LAVIATLFCARHVQVLPQAIEQRGARVKLQVVFFAVDAKRDWDCAFDSIRHWELFGGWRCG
jgi:hypothetical protein